MNSQTRAFIYNVMQRTEATVEQYGVLASLTDDTVEKTALANKLRGVSAVLEHMEEEMNLMEGAES